MLFFLNGVGTALVRRMYGGGMEKEKSPRLRTLYINEMFYLFLRYEFLFPSNIYHVW